MTGTLATGVVPNVIALVGDEGDVDGVELQLDVRDMLSQRFPVFSYSLLKVLWHEEFQRIVGGSTYS